MLIFGFRGTVAEETAKMLRKPNSKVALLDSTTEAIEKFVRSIEHGGYERILGLGSYSGRDTTAIRLETKCTNQFRNKRDDSFQEIAIPLFLKQSSRLKRASGIGNSWCNLVSYKIVITYPSIPFTFLHIPATFSPIEAAAIIDLSLLKP